MKKNRKDNAKRERIIMIASSAFVLTALTMTGIYMQSGEEKSQDDGYTLDFTFSPCPDSSGGAGCSVDAPLPSEGFSWVRFSSPCTVVSPGISILPDPASRGI